jgi:hypothetical protein
MGVFFLTEFKVKNIKITKTKFEEKFTKDRFQLILAPNRW